MTKHPGRLIKVVQQHEGIAEAEHGIERALHRRPFDAVSACTSSAGRAPAGHGTDQCRRIAPTPTTACPNAASATTVRPSPHPDRVWNENRRRPTIATIRSVRPNRRILRIAAIHPVGDFHCSCSNAADSAPAESIVASSSACAPNRMA